MNRRYPDGFLEKLAGTWRLTRCRELRILIE